MANIVGTHIRSDKDTLAKLKVLAGEKPVAQFLRDIATGKDTMSVPVNELEILRASLIKQLDDIKGQIADLAAKSWNVYMAHEKALMTVATQAGMIASYLELRDERPGLMNEIMGAVEKQVKRDWQAHLEKNGMTESDNEG